MQSLCRGVSRMDAAKGVKGHGRPLYADPRSNDGANEPGAKRRAGCRGKRFCLLFSRPGMARLEKVSRPGGRNQKPQPKQKAADARNKSPHVLPGKAALKFPPLPHVTKISHPKSPRTISALRTCAAAQWQLSLPRCSM